jgi:hypothetical protein
VSSRLFHTHFDEFMLPDGQIVPYPSTPEFWMDLGPVLFGITLVLDAGVLLASRHRTLVMIAFALTALATAFNLFYMVGTFASEGFAPISLLATIFGCYILMAQWRILKRRRGAEFRGRLAFLPICNLIFAICGFQCISNCKMQTENCKSNSRLKKSPGMD